MSAASHFPLLFMETTMPDTETVLSWVHFGDLHIKRAEEQNHRDFLALIDKGNRQFDPNSGRQVVREMLSVRAKVWSASGVARVFARVDNGEPTALARDPTDPSLWQASKDVGALSEGLHALTVDAIEIAGSSGRDTIAFSVGRYARPPRIGDGSDRDAIAARPEKGIAGTRLGPDRNGRKW